MGATVLIVLSDHSMDTTPQKIDLTGEFEGAGIAEATSWRSTTAAPT